MPVILIKYFNSYLILIFLGLLCFSACKKKENCEGFDQILELNQLYLSAEDTLQYFENVPNQFFGISFYIFDDYSVSNGTRNCSNDDLTVQFKDEWDENEMSFTCNKTIKSGSDNFLPNTNLLGRSITKLTFEKGFGNKLSNGKINLVGMDGITLSDDYKFTLIIDTKNKKSFTDHQIIHIKN